jgi:Mn2+/Fe2+ NRAMP family transporter
MLFSYPVIAFGSLCAVLQVFMTYTRYVGLLKWLTLALFAYFGTVMVVEIPWPEAARGFLLPTFQPDVAFWTTVVAVLGTTISPYLFFWQAAQEVEEIRVEPERKPLVKAPRQGPDAIERIRLDTYIGMAFSNLVALAIIVTTAATLHAGGVTDIATSKGQGVLCNPHDRDTGRGCAQLFADQSHQGALLERGDQRHRGSARHDHHDAHDGQSKGHGEISHP